MPDEEPKTGRLLKFPPAKEDKEVVAFIDRYLALADLLLAPNVERERPEQKTEPYLEHREDNG